jgi:hypothetical protein
VHYFANGAWLEEDALLRDVGRLAGIPGVLIHGRLDMSGPLDTAWALARAWPDAELHVIGDAGQRRDAPAGGRGDRPVRTTVIRGDHPVRGDRPVRVTVSRTE